jgi:aminoglycoside phosphotransferase family enzyme/predicted kinase
LDVIGFLSSPASYGDDVESVQTHETHASIVFLAGSYAFKLKRAVRYPYLDYSTVERRKAMCEREVGLNRLTARQIYLGVRSIVARRDGSLAFGDAEDSLPAVDWVVVMKRFDEDCLFGSLRKAGRLTVEVARALGSVIADFHLAAESVGDRSGAAEIAAVLDENVSMLRQSSAFARGVVEHLDTQARDALLQLKPLLNRRARSGFVRRCHGDLHLDNICLVDGRPVLIDAIEFNDDFTCIDVLFDLAFPLMELLRHRLVPQANALLNRYIERTGDHGGLAALPLFQSCRAAIRAHVALARMKLEKDGGARQHDLAEANAYLCEATKLLAPRNPRLIAVGGVSGTGKSTLAYALAPSVLPRPGAIVIRSDITRKSLLAVSETTRLPASAYTDAMHAHVFGLMARHAEIALTGGFSVILDGVYGDEGQRERLRNLARACGVPFDAFWLEAGQQALQDRIGARKTDASDATPEVLRRQLASVRSPDDWRVIDATAGPETVLAEALRYLSLDRIS